MNQNFLKIIKKELAILIFIVGVALSQTTMAYNEFSGALIKIGGDLSGYFVKSDTVNMKETRFYTKKSFSLSAEYLFNINDYISFGPGISGSSPVKLKIDESELNSIPIYLAWYFINYISNSLDLFITSRLGYNHFMGNDRLKGGNDLNGSLYYAIGIGTIYEKKLLMEVSYNENQGTMKNESNTQKVKYQHLTLKAGWLF